MRDPDNISAVAALNPDFMGFIFYPPSPRFADGLLDTDLLRSLPPGIRKTGVFVHPEKQQLLKIVEKYGLDFVQLHGPGTPDLNQELRKSGIGVIQAFSVDSAFDFKQTKAYESSSDYFLFDTKGEGFGGHGRPFDWGILKNYEGTVPFLLAGGISNKNAGGIHELHHPAMAGVDVNSRYETAPALKDPEALKILFNTLRVQKSESDIA